MSRTIGRRLALLALCLAVVGVAVPASSLARPASASAAGTLDSSPVDKLALRGAVAGHWRSAACEVAGTGSYRSDLVLSDRASAWTLSVAFYGDTTCERQLLSAEVGGSYRLLGPSSVAPGARHVFFGRDYRQLTPLDGAGAGLLSQVCPSYDWRVGQSRDVSGDGCFFFRSERECRGEYDLLARIGDRLFLAARPRSGDLCDPSTPARILGNPLVRA